MSKISLCLIIVFSIILISLHAQDSLLHGEFVDKRDGKTYQTLQLDNTLWLAENMQFKTEGSENHEINEFGKEIQGYYYPYNEIQDVCPVNFRIPTSKDWEAYIQFLIKLKEIPTSSLEYFKKKKKGKEFAGLNTLNNVLKPFEEPNPLNLRDEGHTQAGKLIAIGSMNVWMKYNDSSDDKYHLHLDNGGYSVHTHKHHIITRKKKLRKFSVRCVRTL